MHHKIKLCVFPMSNNCGEIPINKKKKQFRRNKFLRFLIQNEVVKLSIMDKIKENSTSPHEKISKEGRKRNKYK